MKVKKVKDLSSLRVWQELKNHYKKARKWHLRELFKEDPSRGKRYVIEEVNLYFDFSKNIVNEETINLLLKLAEDTEVLESAHRMISGEKINFTENRPVLHTALRAMSKKEVIVDGKNILEDVRGTLKRMEELAEKVRDGRFLGVDGRPVKNIINVGIGGSDLGPSMCYETLKYYTRRDLNFRFVSNLDPTCVMEAIRDLNPFETLVIVVSKTFTTAETTMNAESLTGWFNKAGISREDTLRKHFIAVTANPARAVSFGIPQDNIFNFWEWVGGRYSLCSAVGLSLMIAIGKEAFRELLYGFEEMDRHFIESSPEKNIPLIMGLLGIWYNNFFGYPTYAVIVYDQYMNRFTDYIQQLDMESNGKSASRFNRPVRWQTGQIIWGQIGTNSQHSFFQLLHQGTKIVPVDFIGFCNSLNPLGKHHDALIANMFAQARALAFGADPQRIDPDMSAELRPHRTFYGNRPSNIIMAERLTPRVLGSLIAMYEHKVFVQGIIWNINSFDQWGVELGKILAKEILHDIDRKEISKGVDSSTEELIKFYLRSKNNSGSGKHKD